MTSNITLTAGSETVTIYTTSVDENGQNNTQDIAIPKTKQTRSQGPTTKVINLCRIITTYNVSGELYSETDANAQKTSFRNICRLGEYVSMVYNGETINGYIKSYKITQKPTDEDPNSTTQLNTPTTWSVNFTFIEGENTIG